MGIGAKEHIEREIDTLMNRISGTKTTVYGRIEFLSTGKFKIAENLLYKTKLRIFKAFLNSESKNLKGAPYENYWKEPDIDFENTLGISLNINIYRCQYTFRFFMTRNKKKELR